MAKDKSGADEALSPKGQREVGRMNRRYEQRMASGEGKGKDVFESSHPDQKRVEEFKKRFGFPGELPPEQLKQMSKEESAASQKQSQAKSEAEMDKAMNLDSYKKGGKVRKTGLGYLHKGERVLTTKQAKRLGHAKSGSKRKRSAK